MTFKRSLHFETVSPLSMEFLGASLLAISLMPTDSVFPFVLPPANAPMIDPLQNKLRVLCRIQDRYKADLVLVNNLFTSAPGFYPYNML